MTCMLSGMTKLFLLFRMFYNDWDKIRLLLGEYDAGKKKGFVRSLEIEYKGIFGSEYNDDYPYELVNYIPDNFSQVIKSTFLNITNE